MTLEPAPIPPKCSHGDCQEESVVAVRTIVTKGRSLRTTIDWDQEDGPKAATRYCQEHTAVLLAALARDLA